MPTGNPYRFLLSLRPCELGVLLKTLLRVKRRVCSIGGWQLWLDPASDLGARLLADHDYEPTLGRCLKVLLKPGDVFLDVGANEGWFTLQAARLVGPTGHVFSLEPQERLWPVILKNLALNGLANCTVLPYAIGAQPGRASLVLTPSTNTGASSLLPGPRRFFRAKQNAQMVTLDQLAELAHVSRIALVKVDVEGFELEVLRSARRLMAEKRVRRWQIETHVQQLQALGTSEADLESLLAANGYRLRMVEGVSVWELPE